MSPVVPLGITDAKRYWSGNWGPEVAAQLVRRSDPYSKHRTAKLIQGSDFFKRRGYAAEPLEARRSRLEAMWQAAPLRFDRRCARCRRRLRSGLGGSYGGVVCPLHRTCEDCWFSRTAVHGLRRFEPRAAIPMVDRPYPNCVGCMYCVPFHESSVPRALATFYGSMPARAPADVIELD